LARILEVIPLLSGLLGGKVTVCWCAVSCAGQLNLIVIADATAVPELTICCGAWRPHDTVVP